MTAPAKFQQGVMLLEAMIGILIFSIGILAMIAMQGLAIGYVSDAKYRSDAAFFANELLGQMWVDRANIPNYTWPGGSSPVVQAWATRVTTTATTALPGAAANPPTVSLVTTVDPVTSAVTYTVTVTVRWMAPNTQSAHSYQTLALISPP